MCKVFGFSHVGNSRTNHEDNYLIGEQYMFPEQVTMISQNRRIDVIEAELSFPFCVAISDGMGGYECGEVASLLTVQYLSSHQKEFFNSIDGYENAIIRCVSSLNDFICKEKKRRVETKGMGATLCGLLSVDGKGCCFNVGDSRLYQYSNGILKQITTDNTEGQRLVGLGLFTEEEVKDFPKRKAIYKYIGKEVELIPDIYEINDIENGTCLLLCSDGLTDALSNEEILEIMNKQHISTLDKGKFLVEIAVEKNKDVGDNITLIIIEY